MAKKIRQYFVTTKDFNPSIDKDITMKIDSDLEQIAFELGVISRSDSLTRSYLGWQGKSPEHYILSYPTGDFFKSDSDIFLTVESFSTDLSKEIKQVFNKYRFKEDLSGR